MFLPKPLLHNLMVVRGVFVLGWVMVMGAVAIVAILFSPRIFGVSSITCQVNSDACPDFILAELAKFQGKWILEPTLLPTLRERLVTHGFFEIDRIAVVLPNHLEVVLRAHPVMYRLQNPAQPNDGINIDSAGVVTAATPQKTVLAVFPSEALYQQVVQTQSLPASSHQALLELSRHESLWISLSNLQLSETVITAKLVDGTNVIVPLQKTDAALAKLEEILKHWPLPQVKGKVQTIDLRFNYPVLKT